MLRSLIEVMQHLGAICRPYVNVGDPKHLSPQVLEFLILYFVWADQRDKVCFIFH